MPSYPSQNPYSETSFEGTMSNQPSLHFFAWVGESSGGAAKIVYDLALTASQKGFLVTLGVFKKNPEYSLPQIVIPIPAFVPSSFKSLLASFVFQIIHAHRFHIVYAHTLGFWKNNHNKLFVHDAADLDEKYRQIPDQVHRLAYSFWSWLYLNTCLRQADTVFAATQKFYAYLQKHNIDTERILLSGSYFDQNIFHFSPCSHPRQPFKILFVGRPDDPAKNFVYLRQHLYKVPHLQLTVIGGTKSYKDHNFRFLAASSPQTVAKHMHASHLFILPSISEGFPLVLLEALASGLPCLASAASIPAELSHINSLHVFDITTTPLPAIQNIMDNYPSITKPPAVLAQFHKDRILNLECHAILHSFDTDPLPNNTNF